MRKLRWSKVFAGCLAAVMVTSVMPAGTAFAKEEEATPHKTAVESSAVDASALNVNVDFYDYNIKKYKGEKVDEDTKIALNAYQMELVSGSGIGADELFLFGGDRRAGTTGSHNVWTGWERAQYQGIVKDRLDSDGNLIFNEDAGIYSVNIFPQEGDTALEDAGVVETYYNTNFQFLYEDGTYQYDSAKHASYNLKKDSDGNGVLETDLTKPGPCFSKGVGTYSNQYGFFPLNEATGTDHQASPDSRHHMFGMKMELAFFMPEDGKVETESDSSEKRDMVFQFSGDDDVWVFVDGHLALDLGGIHDTVDGEINFATGKVTYEKATTGGIKTNVTNIYDAYDIDQTAFSEHTLTMFYLERGEYDSNCKITFNIPTVVTNDDISITKKVENVPEGNTDTFDFKLLYGEEENKLTNVFEGTYRVYDSSNAYVEERHTKDGCITLAAGETAVIDKEVIKRDQYYMVQEVNTTARYLSSWITTGQIEDNTNSGNGKQTDVLVRNDENPSGSHIEFTNYYRTLTQLALKKMVDSDAYAGEAFEFRVTIGTDTYHVSLKDGETKVFEEVPLGIKYTITEIITAGAIYTTPDATINGEKAEITQQVNAWYQLEGVTGTDLEDGAVTEVVYTNHAPEVTKTPEVTETPEITDSPSVTTTPGATEKPQVTDTPKVTGVPSTTTKPHNPTEKPTEGNTPVPQTETPETEMPETEAPETKVPETENPATKAPETDVPETENPGTKLPDTTAPATKVPEVELPQTEKPQDAPATPTGTPIVVETPDVPVAPAVTVTKAPVVTETPLETETPFDVIEDDTNIPNDPVVAGTKKPKRTPDVKATPKVTKKPDASTDRSGTIVEDDIPGELPQTGGIGSFAKKTTGFGWLIVVPILLVAGCVYIVERKKQKKEK